MFKKLVCTIALVAATLGPANAAETMTSKEKALYTATLLTYKKLCSGRMPEAGTLWIEMHKGTFTDDDTAYAVVMVGKSVERFGKNWCSKIGANAVKNLDG